MARRKIDLYLLWGEGGQTWLPAYHGPATQAQALTAYDSGKGYQDHISDTYVDQSATPVGYTGKGHQKRAMFECRGRILNQSARWQGAFCSSLLPWISGWSTGIPSMWPSSQCSDVCCGVVSTLHTPHPTQLMWCFTISRTNIRMCMITGNGTI